MKERLGLAVAVAALLTLMVPTLAVADRAGDRVIGHGRITPQPEAAAVFSVSAHRPTGTASARGTLVFRLTGSAERAAPGRARANVVCMFVKGNQAVIAGVWKRGERPFGPAKPVAILYVEDNGRRGIPRPDLAHGTGTHGAPEDWCNESSIAAWESWRDPIEDALVGGDIGME